MSVQIIPVSAQARGQFNGGAILENKPIGFPQDGGDQKPYSNLLYWAHAWTPKGESLIGEHPHQAFEIMTFVLRGSVDHYDSGNDNWRTLSEGDAQIIRAGSGVSHAERMHADTEMFQIWVDPDIRRTLGQPASYNDYPSSAFPVTGNNGRRVKTYHDGTGPMEMTTPGLRIAEETFDAGEHEIQVDGGRVLSAYVLEGPADIDGSHAETGDFVLAHGAHTVSLTASAPVRLFVIDSPVDPGYETYASRFG